MQESPISKTETKNLNPQFEGKPEVNIPHSHKLIKLQEELHYLTLSTGEAKTKIKPEK